MNIKFLGLLKQVLYNKAALMKITPEFIKLFCKQKGHTAFSEAAFIEANNYLDHLEDERNYHE